MKTLIADVETDGLLDTLTRIHCLCVKDFETKKKYRFRRNNKEDTIREGLRMLEDADMLVFHNGVDFDMEAIWKVYPDFSPRGVVRDSLVLSRMIFADIKDSDFRLWNRGELPGKLIGGQGLEAWGYRLGLHKGDYAKEKTEELKEIHRAAGMEPPTEKEIVNHVWGTWNPEMEDYCENDVDVTDLLWTEILAEEWPESSTVFEHQVQALMSLMERNGFPFNVIAAEKLAAEIQREIDDLERQAVDEIGIWIRPKKTYTGTPREEYGEDDSRHTWAEVQVPKRTMNYSKANARHLEKGDYASLRPNVDAGAAFCPVEIKEFNPGSRPQIIDRLSKIYGWTPQDFTEKGNPKVDDTVLNELAETIPLAGKLAELFFRNKILGQLATGSQAWLKQQVNGRIHGRTNPGGTVSGRCSHSNPNLGQVKSVQVKEAKDEISAKHIRDSYVAYIVKEKYKQAKGEWHFVMKGRPGEYGYDCRNLFEVDEGYNLVGADLSGIEFRCLANLTCRYDNGELIDIVLNGDIHQLNADRAGISRSVAKRALYAAMYGGGDAKLGYIVDPTASEFRQRNLGKDLRRALMQAMPSLERAIKEIQREVKRNKGWIQGLDGRRLFARSPHSALNLRLQSDGALIAKKWCLITEQLLLDSGYEHGAGLDFAFQAFVHDEIQVAARKEIAQQVAVAAEKAAPMAGEFFGFQCPVAAESSIGRTWAETH